MTSAHVKIEDLRVAYPGPNGPIDLVHGVSLELHPGETLALVGESGAGKSLTARTLLDLLPAPTFVRSGVVNVSGHDMVKAPESTLCRLRGSVVSFVPQDPMIALNPVRRIGTIFKEITARHPCAHDGGPTKQIADALTEVGLRNSVLECYPHQLSGGMKQRVLIALALVTQPRVIVADEPTTALDATVQAQILDLLARRVAGRVSLLLITHDLGVAATVCSRIAIMYNGRIVEAGPTRDLLRNPRHPYTRGLLAAAPNFSEGGGGLIPIPGRPPRPGEKLAGCAFAPRCARADKKCQEMPHLETADKSVACWHPYSNMESQDSQGVRDP